MIITVGNSRCYVDGTTEERVMLEKIMTVDTGRFNPRGRGNIIHRFFKVNDTSFPTGLLAKVIAAPVFGPDGAMKIELVEGRTRVKVPKRVKKLPGIKYHTWQTEAIEKMLGARMGLINVATNGGKTVIMIGYAKTIEKQPIRGIIITHSAEIHAQLYKVFKQYLGKKVGRITSKVTDVRGRQFVVAMAMTLRNRIGDDPYVTQLFDEHKLLMADEAHHLTAKTWSDIFKESNAPLRFGFSGTIPKPNVFKGWQVMASGGKILIDVRNAELIEAGVSAQIGVLMFRRDWSEMFVGFYNACISDYARVNGRLFGGSGRWKSQYLKMQFFREFQQMSFAKGIVHNKKRNEDIVKKVIDRKQRQCLLITERLDHGKNLAKLFDDAGHQAEFIHGDAPNRNAALEEFRAGRLRTLVSSQILDEGIDIAGIQTLVMAGVMKCERALLQRTGRGLRKKVGVPNELEVIDFMDSGNRYLERYSKERKAIFEEEGFPVQVVD